MNQVKVQHVDEVDRADEDDPQMVAEYCVPVMQHLRETENEFRACPNYMGNQVDINEKMRGILIDWVCEVHLRFRLLPETLFLSVSLIDRFLNKVQVLRSKLQLVAVAAMFIASKYEELITPTLSDFAFIADNAYSKTEILSMERQILVTLEFNITVPSAYGFLQRFCKVAKAKKQLFHLAQYLIELTLIEQRMLVYQPSLIAASALNLAIRILYRELGKWTPTLRQYTGYSEGLLRPCFRDMCVLFTGIEKCQL